MQDTFELPQPGDAVMIAEQKRFAHAKASRGVIVWAAIGRVLKIDTMRVWHQVELQIEGTINEYGDKAAAIFWIRLHKRSDFKEGRWEIVPQSEIDTPLVREG